MKEEVNTASSPFSHTEPPRPAGHLQLKSPPWCSQVPPWRHGCELQGFWALWLGGVPTWETVLVGGGVLVVMAVAVVEAAAGGAVFGGAVVVLRLPLKGRRVVPGGRRVTKGGVV